jgi:hypothetical protein
LMLLSEEEVKRWEWSIHRFSSSGKSRITWRLAINQTIDNIPFHSTINFIF